MKTNQIVMTLLLCAMVLFGCENSNKVQTPENEIVEDTISEDFSEEAITEDFAVDTIEEEYDEDDIWAPKFPLEDYMKTYADFIDANIKGSYPTFALLNISGGDIPEMVLQGYCEADAYVVLTQKDGVVDMRQTPRLDFSCILGTGLCACSTMHMGTHWDCVYRIVDGKFEDVIQMEWTEEEDGGEVDASGLPVVTLNGEPIDRSEIDPEKLLEEEYYSKGEVLNFSPYNKPEWAGVNDDAEVKITPDWYYVFTLRDWAEGL